jgi:hypothetical protein
MKLNARIEQVERLKKENTELRERNQKLLESCDETQELLDKQIEATYKLVEENAELKKENESLTNVKNIYIGDLLKAKEILKKFLDAKSIEETCVAESEAEQFLSCKEILNN